MLKKCGIVMLPTNEKANLFLSKGKLEYKKLFTEHGQINLTKMHISNNIIPQHLYFTSNDEIKGRNWVYNPIYKTVYQWIKNADIKFDRIDAKKIIATNNTSLLKDYSEQTLNDFASLPQPSKSFIEVFVKEYNKGNIITDVLVEYEEIEEPPKMAFSQYTEEELREINNHPISWIKKKILKVNPKDNTITIKKVKDNFTLQELEDALVKHYISISSTKGCNLGEDVRKWTKKWIEENLDNNHGKF